MELPKIPPITNEEWKKLLKSAGFTDGGGVTVRIDFREDVPEDGPYRIVFPDGLTVEFDSYDGKMQNVRGEQMEFREFVEQQKALLGTDSEVLLTCDFKPDQTATPPNGPYRVVFPDGPTFELDVIDGRVHNVRKVGE